jgi:microcystin-dependent protein
VIVNYLHLLVIKRKGLAMTIKTGEPMLADDINYLTFFPKGTILMFDGTEYQKLLNSSASNYKNIWKLCDGQNGTPDLRDKFIMGSVSSGAGESTAKNWQTLTKEQMPGHSHRHTHDTHTGTVDGVDAGATNIFGNASGVFSVSGNAGRQQSSGGNARDACYRLSFSARHSYDETAAGGGQAFDNRPAYYCLVYIIKVV